MELRVEGATAGGEAVSSIVVTKNGFRPEYDVSIDTFNCGHEFALIQVKFQDFFTFPVGFS